MGQGLLPRRRDVRLGRRRRQPPGARGVLPSEPGSRRSQPDHQVLDTGCEDPRRRVWHGAQSPPPAQGIGGRRHQPTERGAAQEAPSGARRPRR